MKLLYETQGQNATTFILLFLCQVLEMLSQDDMWSN